MTRSEKFVYNICNKTFLSLWSFPNPLGKKGKELCDVLVICEPDIIIFSVKEINIKGSDKVAVKRWKQRAIDESVKQIYGAERYLNSTNNIILKDKKTNIELNKEKKWRIHRIAVCFGRGENLPLAFGDFGKGFVHVFDEKSFQIVLVELDTIRDFLDYLTKKELLVKSNKKLFLMGEEDLLGFYLSNGLSFPEDADTIIFHDDIWKGLQNDKDYKKYKEDIKVSYQWDKIINILIDDYRDNKLVKETSRDDLELTLRDMSRENRQSRKILSEKFLDFIGYYGEPKSTARFIKSLENPELIYLFLLGELKDRDHRVKELHLRSLVVRYINKDCKRVVGIATEPYTQKGFSLDFAYLHLPVMTNDTKEKVKMIINDLGYFKNPVER